MHFKSISLAIAAAFAAIVPFQSAAYAAPGTYYVGTTVASNPVLWAYVPQTGLIKLCYATVSNTLACTTPKAVFATLPPLADNLQYRISQQSENGGLWILDLTTNKQALCTAAIPASAYVVTCTLGSGNQ